MKNIIIAFSIGLVALLSSCTNTAIEPIEEFDVPQKVEVMDTTSITFEINWRTLSPELQGYIIPGDTLLVTQCNVVLLNEVWQNLKDINVLGNSLAHRFDSKIDSAFVGVNIIRNGIMYPVCIIRYY